MSSPAIATASVVPTTTMTCRACGHAGQFPLIATREMFFGWRHPFEYGECPHCASLQIRDIPENLAKYYPDNYYSLVQPGVRAKKPRPGQTALDGWLLRSRGRLARFAMGRLQGKYPFLHWCRMAGCGLGSRILDVGCGSGALLRRMQRHGFHNLTGVDPYTSIEADEPGFRIRRAELKDVGGRYDLIMLHHVLEHLVDPQRSLEDARARLNPGGRILIRIPVAASCSFRLYRENWFNLDPPRHLLVPSRRGMETLADRSGFRVVRTEFDGMEFGFLISEHYRRDTPYMSRPEDGYWRRRRAHRWAKAANRSGKGDQGVFLLEAK